MLPFNLPLLPQHPTPPTWNGMHFVLGEQELAVLEYSESFAGWSDDLTSLHEEVAGSNHAIDCASRHDALQQIQKAIQTDEPVLMEIGCSSGFLLHEIKNAFPKATVIGADVVKAPLYKLAEKNYGIPLIRFDLLQCVLPNQIVDGLLMINVLEHIEDDCKALENAFHLLKPGGHLIIEVPAGPWLYDAYDAELRHFRRYSAAALQKKLIRAGFKVQRKSHLGALVFPAFVLAKLRNKFLNKGTKKTVVRDSIKKTSENRLLRLAMNLETKYLSNYSLPFGIRVLITAQKPLS